MRRAFGSELSAAIETSCSDLPIEVGELTLGERGVFDNLKDGERREEWLRGRGRLKEVLRCLEESEDTSRLKFPNARFSLSHSGDRAMAVGIPDTRGIDGIGVDMERPRPVKAEAARFFLNEIERQRLTRSTESDRLRLWTVKEALFKAHPENEGQGVKDYFILFPDRLSGSAVHPRSGRRFLYHSEASSEGVLTVAVCLSEEA